MKSEKSQIGLWEMYLGACILAASNGGNIRRALYQAEELANLCEQDWENRLRQLERQRMRYAVECAGIRKNWSLGIQIGH